MNESLQKEINKTIEDAFFHIPNLISKQIKDVIISEICEQLDLRCHFGKYEPKSAYSNENAFRKEIKEYVHNQFKAVIQQNIFTLLDKQDTTAILRTAKRQLDLLIKNEIKELLSEELQIIASTEAARIVTELKQDIIKEYFDK